MESIHKFGLLSSFIYSSGDAITTYFNYNRAGVVEGNPFMQQLINLGWLHFFAVKIVLFIFFVICITYLHGRSRKLATAGAMVVLALGFFTVFNNTLLI